MNQEPILVINAEEYLSYILPITFTVTTVFLFILTILLLIISFIVLKLLFAFFRFHIKKQHYLKQKMPFFPAMTLINSFSPTGTENILNLLTKDDKVEDIVMGGSHFDGTPGVLVNHPELLKKVMNEDDFAKYPKGYDPTKVLLGNGLVTSKGSIWKRQRRLLTPIFHFHKLKLMAPIMERNIKNWLKMIREKKGEKVDPVAMFCDLTLRVIIESAFGGLEVAGSLNPDQLIPIWYSISDLFSNYFLTILLIGRFLTMWLPLPWVLSFRWKIQKLRKIIRKSLEEKRKNINNNINNQSENSEDNSKDQSDLVLEMLNVRDENGKPIDDELIIDEAVTFLFAGHETTSNTLAWTFYFLTRNPIAFQKLREEVDSVLPNDLDNDENFSLFEYLPKLQYCKAVLFETLRLRPAAAFLDRVSLHDCNLGGYDIPKGSLVTLSLIGPHMNKDYFENPKEFNPDRFLSVDEGKRHAFSFVPFSGGPRNCIGQKFAIQEAISILSLTVKSFDITADLNERVFNSFKVTSCPLNFYCRFIDRNQ